MIINFFKFLFNINRELEVFTKVLDGKELVAKSKHKGIIKLTKKGFHLECDRYVIPLYCDLSKEKEFGIETKYVLR